MSQIIILCGDQPVTDDEKQPIRRRPALLCGMLDGLAFLTESEVPAGMGYLRGVAPALNGVTQLWDYFDATNSTARLSASSGRQMSSRAVRLRRILPASPPEKWNVYEATLTDSRRTNDECERWTQRFSAARRSLLPRCLVMVATGLMKDGWGQLPAKRARRPTVQLQSRLCPICRSLRDGQLEHHEILCGVGHHTVCVCADRHDYVDLHG